MKHHLIIGGTGRAGTTFLVQYLAACGLETQIARNAHYHYDADAHAGLEDVPVGNPDLTYVLKSPWLFAYVERLLADEEVIVDAVIVPMRSLVEAASSRAVNELRARYGTEGLPEDCTRWEFWGTTPGGMLYSLNPIDEARLLALGFHQLIHALVKRDIPIVLLDFPRFVEDPDYLYEKLRSVLGDRVERARALDAFQACAAPEKVRVGKELAAVAAPRSPPSDARSEGISFPSHAALDRVALRRELDKVRTRATQLEAQLAGAASKTKQLEEQLADAASKITQLEGRFADASWKVMPSEGQQLAGATSKPAAPKPASGQDVMARVRAILGKPRR